MNDVIEPANYIDGEWIAAREAVADINPSDLNDVVGEFPRSTAADVDRAVAAARDAFPGWSASSPQDRADLLERVAAQLYARVDEFGALLAREEGKPLREAVAEATRAAQIFRFFSGEALRMTGTHQDSTRAGVEVDVLREPIGVVGVLSPWNFPLAIPAWKVAPALAYGNTVVFKPAELTPACAQVLVECLAKAGLPPGALNLVHGQGRVVGEAIVRSEGVDAVTFTGSDAVGAGIASLAVARQARVQLEMGGKNPLVVLADCDLDKAVDVALGGAYFSTGQRCTASSRLIVESAIHDEFVERLSVRMTALVVGDARDPSTQVGPVVSEGQLSTDVSYIEMARADRGVTVIGGRPLERSTPGYYLEPALIVESDPSATYNVEEIFGPVASVFQAATYDEALALANDTQFGLSAGICTTSLAKASHFRKYAAAGMVMVNLPTAGVDPHVPFGGRKGSSYGPREQGTAAREFFTTTKTVYTAP
jgi:alpha-ketoglutaric semialdehyde dehydrogenase